jgi:hypothetical protein
MLLSYYKLELFVAKQQIFLVFIKQFSPQKIVSNFALKQFYEIDPRACPSGAPYTISQQQTRLK